MSESSIGEPSTLLVVDDEPMVVQYLETELQSQGYRVYSANSAEQALEVARRYGPLDAALVDLALPNSSGLELISKLRELQGDLLVIIASGYAHLAVRDQDASPAAAVLGKPFDAGSLARCLRGLGLGAGGRAN